MKNINWTFGKKVLAGIGIVLGLAWNPFLTLIALIALYIFK